MMIGDKEIHLPKGADRQTICLTGDGFSQGDASPFLKGRRAVRCVSLRNPRPPVISGGGTISKLNPNGFFLFSRHRREESHD